MTTPKGRARKGATGAIEPAVQAVTDAATAAIGAVTPPVLDLEKPAGTIDAAPAAPAEAETAPEPITWPVEGGSYLRDPVTGHLKLQEA